MQLFGGKSTSLVDLTQVGIPNDYLYNNFNDFASGLVTLFEFLMVNNWNVQMEMFAYIYGSPLVKVFFISFYVVGTILALGIIIAFTIDIIVGHLGAQRAARQKQNIIKIIRQGSARNISELEHHAKTPEMRPAQPSLSVDDESII
jgi:hypothetical protein